MAEPHRTLNALPLTEARAALERCCGSRRWVEAMLARRPFLDELQLMAASDAVLDELGRDDLLEAFAHHPPIGLDLEALRQKFGASAELSAGEQAGALQADRATLEALRDHNRAYLERFGFIFIVCASGKSAAEMLALLERRLHNPPDVELGIAAAEQGKISKLRLEKLG